MCENAAGGGDVGSEVLSSSAWFPPTASPVRPGSRSTGPCCRYLCWHKPRHQGQPNRLHPQSMDSVSECCMHIGVRAILDRVCQPPVPHVPHRAWRRVEVATIAHLVGSRHRCGRKIQCLGSQGPYSAIGKSFPPPSPLFFSLCLCTSPG